MSVEELPSFIELSDVVKILNFKSEAARAKLLARETAALARVAELEWQNFLKEIYLRYKMGLNDKINDDFLIIREKDLLSNQEENKEEE